MGNGISIYPADLMFDYRPVSGRFNGKRDKLIGFCCSLSVHICMLTIAGVVFIKPVEFGVDRGLYSMEVQLVAGTEQATVAPSIVQDNPVDPPMIQEKDVVIEEAIKEPRPAATQEMESKKLSQEDSLKSSNIGNSPINAFSSGQGAITEAQPFYLRNPAPGYPLKARQNGWEGTVLLGILVNKDGYPVKVEVEKSSGHAVLDEAALKTVKTWQFRPAKFGNIPVESAAKVPVKFRLEDHSGFSKRIPKRIPNGFQTDSKRIPKKT